MRVLQTSTETPPTTATPCMKIGRENSAIPEAPGVGLTSIAIQSDNCLAKTSRFCTESKNMYKTAFSIKNLEVQLTKVTPIVFTHIVVVAPFKLSDALIHSSVNDSAQSFHLLNNLILNNVKKISRVFFGRINKTNKINSVKMQ
nr:hypothetical protein [uncultured bacterium]